MTNIIVHAVSRVILSEVDSGSVNLQEELDDVVGGRVIGFRSPWRVGDLETICARPAYRTNVKYMRDGISARAVTIGCV